MYGHVQHGEELNRPNPVRKEFLRTTSLRILNTDGLNNLKYVASAKTKFWRKHMLEEHGLSLDGYSQRYIHQPS
jgi:hypothetical protein